MRIVNSCRENKFGASNFFKKITYSSQVKLQTNHLIIISTFPIYVGETKLFGIKKLVLAKLYCTVSYLTEKFRFGTSKR